MKPVFGDAGFFLALINPRDQYHRSAAELKLGLSVPLVTPPLGCCWNLPMRSPPAVLENNSEMCWHGCALTRAAKALGRKIKIDLVPA